MTRKRPGAGGSPLVQLSLIEEAVRLRTAIEEAFVGLNDNSLKKNDVRVLLARTLDLVNQLAPPDDLLTPRRRPPLAAAPAVGTDTAAALSSSISQALRTAPARAGRVRITPSPEQATAIDLAEHEPVLKIRALAGTGKTTTLEGIADRLEPQGKMLYLAFSRMLRQEAKLKFPKHVDVHTVHSLAYKAVIADYKATGQNPVAKVPLATIVRLFGWGKDGWTRAHYVRELFEGFCSSADPVVLPSHLSPSVASSLRARLAKEYGLTEGFMLSLRVSDYVKDLVPLAQELFDEAAAVDRLQVHVTYNSYLKVWAMRGEILPVHCVMCDEAQDLSPVMLQIIRRQQERARIILVGDEWQSIYRFRGAVNALSQVDGRETALTGSYRFGKNIADVANSLLKQLNSDIFLQGLSGDAGTLVDRFDPSEQVAYISRTNAEVFSGAVTSCLENVPFFVAGGVDEMCEEVMSAYALWRGNLSEVHSQALRGYYDWAHLKRTIEETGDGMLARIVRVVDRYGNEVPALVENLARSALKRDEQGKARRLYGTAHSCKGLEFKNVELAEDFPLPGSGKQTDEQRLDELNLLYVSVTRAKSKLKMNSVVSGFHEMAG